MNTISSLETTDLPAAYHIEQRAHAFPWSEKTFASNQGERYLNFQLTQNGKMAAAFEARTSSHSVATPRFSSSSIR
ncbi:hypothetical protein ACT4UM_14240, partial [Bacillus sp. SS-TM]